MFLPSLQEVEVLELGLSDHLFISLESPVIIGVYTDIPVAAAEERLESKIDLRLAFE